MNEVQANRWRRKAAAEKEYQSARPFACQGFNAVYIHKFVM